MRVLTAPHSTTVQQKRKIATQLSISEKTCVVKHCLRAVTATIPNIWHGFNSGNSINRCFSGDVKQKKKKDTNEEAFEDSDDGDEEGRELDYISDSSDSEPENINLDSVAEEKALRLVKNIFNKLLDLISYICLQKIAQL